MNFKEAAKKWKGEKDSTKEKFDGIAAEENEERAKRKDLWELINGVKPSRPVGPFSYFVADMAKKKTFKDGKNVIAQCGEKWAKMSDDAKEEYFRMGKKSSLIYEVKMAEYKKQVKHNSGATRGKSALNIFIEENSNMAKGKDLPQGGFLGFMTAKFKALPEKDKEKYEKKAENSRRAAQTQSQAMAEKVHDIPKRAPSGYTLYLKERMKTIKNEPKHKNKEQSEIFKTVAAEWNDMPDNKKEAYNAESEGLREEFKQNKAEFKKLGFYTPGGNPDFVSRSQKSGMSSSKKSKSKSKSKVKSRSKSKRSKSKQKKSGKRSKVKDDSDEKETRGRTKSKTKKETKAKSKGKSKSKSKSKGKSKTEKSKGKKK